MPERIYDLLTMGRSCIDLYASEVAPFPKIKNFAAYVGGCPTNISVGTRRLGLHSALLTAVGDDPVGEFVLNFLKSEQVDTQFITIKQGYRTSAVLLGMEPTGGFPLVYYRANCADIELTIDDVLASSISSSQALLISGTGLSKEPSRSATVFAAEQARTAGTKVLFDLDLRPDQWHDLRAFGVVTRSVLPLVDICIGTEDEVRAIVLTHAAQATVTGSQVSDAHITGDTDSAVKALLSKGPQALAVKRGQHGAQVYLRSGEVIKAPGFPVEVYNILGAGDAFASGFIYGYLHGWNWYKSARMGNACGAIVVTRHGCANFMPYEQEALDFIASRGGF